LDWIWRCPGGYTLWVCQNSYRKWHFIVDLPIKHGDVPYSKVLVYQRVSRVGWFRSLEMEKSING
jgi:hypothetical protein